MSLRLVETEGYSYYVSFACNKDGEIGISAACIMASCEVNSLQDVDKLSECIKLRFGYDNVLLLGTIPINREENKSNDIVNNNQDETEIGVAEFVKDVVDTLEQHRKMILLCKDSYDKAAEWFAKLVTKLNSKRNMQDSIRYYKCGSLTVDKLVDVLELVEDSTETIFIAKCDNVAKYAKLINAYAYITDGDFTAISKDIYKKLPVCMEIGNDYVDLCDFVPDIDAEYYNCEFTHIPVVHTHYQVEER